MDFTEHSLLGKMKDLRPMKFYIFFACIVILISEDFLYRFCMVLLSKRNAVSVNECVCMRSKYEILNARHF